jgi:thymidylate synthase
MDRPLLFVETPLFPRESLTFYTRFNLGDIDKSKPDDVALLKKYYNAARGGGQGDYRVGIRQKIDNITDCLTRFPGSKRAVLAIPFTTLSSADVSHEQTDEAKCLRELHFYVEDGKLCCTGFMRAQAASIFPKNIHFIGTILNDIAEKLKVPPGSYTHFVTTLVSDRS